MHDAKGTVPPWKKSLNRKQLNESHFNELLGSPIICCLQRRVQTSLSDQLFSVKADGFYIQGRSETAGASSEV